MRLQRVSALALHFLDDLPAFEVVLGVGEGVVGRITVAYEPVWAIGTGRVPSVEDIGAIHRAIRARLVQIYGDDGAGVSILYGGSVNAGNAVELLAADEVGGALVGGASLQADSFLAIVLAAGGPGEE